MQRKFNKSLFNYMERRKKPLNKLTILPLVIGVLLIGYSGYALFKWHKATTGVAPEISDQTTTYTDPNPSEVKPECQDYKVPDDKPRYINLPTIEASGCIIKVGVDQHNAIAAPASIYLAGWYTGSALPGSEGVSLIDGHVSGKYSDGIFKHIKNLKPADEFSVEFGDGSKKQFEVVSVNSYSINDSKDFMLRQDSNISNQLNLITCTGSFDKQSQQYEQRVIVVSKSK